MTATQNRIVWDSHYGQDLAADIVRKPRRTDESVSEIEAWGVVNCPAGKSYRVACYRRFDRTAERGERVTWDCAVYIGAGKGSRIAPESTLEHVRLFAVRMFKRAVEACAAADWDCGDARWPARDPQKAAVADYAEAVRDLARVAQMEGAAISGETLAFNQENAAEHEACEADSVGLFDIEATDNAISWARIHAAEGRARAAGFAVGKGPIDRENPHMEGTGHAIAWAEGYAAGRATVARDPAPLPADERARAVGKLRLSGSVSAPVAAQNVVRLNLARQAGEMAAIADKEAGERGGQGLRQVIDMTPTWAAILPALLAALEHGTPEGRRIAQEELNRLARIADDLKIRRDVRKANAESDDEDGRAAAARKSPPTCCPYDTGSGRAANWLAGYAAALYGEMN